MQARGCAGVIRPIKTREIRRRYDASGYIKYRGENHVDEDVCFRDRARHVEHGVDGLRWGRRPRAGANTTTCASANTAARASSNAAACAACLERVGAKTHRYSVAMDQILIQRRQNQHA